MRRMSTVRAMVSGLTPRRLASTLGKTTPKSESGRVVVSGIQPTGVPHLGNYLGALKNWVNLQKNASPNDQLYFFIASLHALTVPQNPTQLYKDRRQLLATLIAIGLDPNRCTIFLQDHIPEHAELGWYLMCMSSFGRLERMTTWKSKIATLQNSGNIEHVNESQLQLGLFAYPVLQAADILMYRATHVPVGDDQTQHLELTRDLATQFNRAMKNRFFRPPEQLISAYTIKLTKAPSKRVLSLRHPDQKMSKSAPDANSRILITDTPEQIRSKIKKAVTDSMPNLSFDPANRPAVSNLLQILAGFDGGVLRKALTSSEDPKLLQDPSFVAQILNDRMGGSGASLKAALTETIVEELRPIQEEYHRLETEVGYLDSIAQLGCEKARAQCQETMQGVRKLLGLHG